ncbi:ATP-dependent helicase [Acinetobacter pittii]|uniref:UvrD-helicase domain-containing protein n=1 Tax=Acinetobacter pittii TaxID=48296 RepID=UPI0026F23719|nr:ATP-dependent helicase [Acinetobacter pittii]MDO7243226.1 ATP-dependent helicase [Acinetobacter pittii]
MNDYFTSEQKEAIFFQENLVIVACPGSGKTTVIKEKVRNISSSLKSHQGVIGITFTRKASLELKKRCKENGHDTKQSFFGTIDKFCLEQLIFPFLSHLWKGKSREYIVVEELNEEQKGLFLKKYKSATINDINKDQGFNELYNRGYLWVDSFSGLALYVLNNSKSAVKYIKSKFTHVFIDEYQDSSKAQHDLFLKLVEIGLIGTAVGDVNQSIYNFRGSNPKFIKFLLKSQNFKSIYMDVNHRCHLSINNYASRLLDPLYPIEEDLEECRVFRRKFEGDYTEISDNISKIIRNLISKKKIINYSDVVVLANKNKILNDIASRLNLNYRLYIDTPLEEIKSQTSALFFDLLSLRFGAIDSAQNILDKYFLKNGSYIANNISKVREKILKVKECEDVDLNFNLSVIANDLGYIQTDKEKDAVQSILNDSRLLKLFRPIESTEVQMMSLHKSKGLEFHTVIHVGLEEWVFPSREYTGSWGDEPLYPNLNQDLNLHYVGITRAKEYCILIQASKRINSKGYLKNTDPSYFLTLPQLKGLYK